MCYVPRDYVTIYLKSGRVIEVECKEANLYYDNDTGKLRHYLFVGQKKPNKLHLDFDSIEAIVVNTKQVKIY